MMTTDHVDQVSPDVMAEMRAHLEHSFRYDTERMSDEDIIATMDEVGWQTGAAGFVEECCGQQE